MKEPEMQMGVYVTRKNFDGLYLAVNQPASYEVQDRLQIRDLDSGELHWMNKEFLQPFWLQPGDTFINHVLGGTHIVVKEINSRLMGDRSQMVVYGETDNMSGGSTSVLTLEKHYQFVESGYAV